VGHSHMGQSLLQLFIYYPILQIFPNFEIQLNCLAVVKKNLQTFLDARVEYFEQLLQLSRLQISNRIQVIKFGTKSTLNFSLIF
jgi:hypothetical protein